MNAVSSRFHNPRLNSYLAAAVLLAFSLQATIAQSEFTLKNATALLDHWPGPDGAIGTGDDVVSSTPSTTNQSAPNASGALSYNAFDFGQGDILDADLFPPQRQAITFLDEGNTISIDSDVAENGGGALITGWNVSGSEPFPGHGPYTAQITAVNSGSYDPVSRQFTQNIDFTANLASGPANSSNFDLSGTAYWLEAADYDAGTGSDYVDSVLIPIAKAMNAGAMLYVMGTGTVPAADNFGFPEMDITAALFAVAASDDPGEDPPLVVPEIRTDGAGTVTVSWPSTQNDVVVESSPSLESDALWTEHTGPYEVDGESFVLAEPSADPMRFFRLRRTSE